MWIVVRDKGGGAASSGEDTPREHAYAVISVRRTDYHYVWTNV